MIRRRATIAAEMEIRARFTKPGGQTVHGVENASLVRAAGAAWHDATRAAFLDAVGDGTLPVAAFHRWLEQDYRFARGLLSFQAVVAAKTPRPSHKPVLAGLAAIDAELDWFEHHLTQRELSTEAPVHPVCRRYVDFLLAAAYAQPFEASLAVLFGVEACYLVAWSGLEAKGPYAEFITRWSSDAFAAYVRALQELAERHSHPAQQPCFEQTLRHERDFWRMTWEG
jgi:thiaminase/transcriptional activator TenA